MNFSYSSSESEITDLGPLENAGFNLQLGFPIGVVFSLFLAPSWFPAWVALLGIPPGDMAIDWNEVIFKGLVLKGIYGREMFETWYKMSSMLQSGLNMDPIITHHFPIDEFQPAFDLMESGQSGKVILHWS